MELRFLGRGSGFNSKEGSTAAFFIEDRKMYLIDCGELTRARIIELGLLEDIDAVYFICTHTHSDHVGSLGNLVLYCKDVLGIQFYIVCPVHSSHCKNLETLLEIFGCRDHYQVFDYRLLSARSFSSMKYIPTTHDRLLKESYSIEFETPDGVIYYSGDTNSTKRIDYYIQTHAKIARLYLDTTTSKESESFHLSLSKLADIIPSEMRSKCYCMHVNSDECISRAKSLGFNVVECEQK